MEPHFGVFGSEKHDLDLPLATPPWASKWPNGCTMWTFLKQCGLKCANKSALKQCGLKVWFKSAVYKCGLKVRVKSVA